MFRCHCVNQSALMAIGQLRLSQLLHSILPIDNRVNRRQTQNLCCAGDHAHSSLPDHSHIAGRHLVARRSRLWHAFSAQPSLGKVAAAGTSQCVSAAPRGLLLASVTAQKPTSWRDEEHCRSQEGSFKLLQAYPESSSRRQEGRCCGRLMHGSVCWL